MEEVDWRREKLPGDKTTLSEQQWIDDNEDAVQLDL